MRARKASEACSRFISLLPTSKDAEFGSRPRGLPAMACRPGFGRYSSLGTTALLEDPQGYLRFRGSSSWERCCSTAARPWSGLARGDGNWLRAEAGETTSVRPWLQGEFDGFQIQRSYKSRRNNIVRGFHEILICLGTPSTLQQPPRTLRHLLLALGRQLLRFRRPHLVDRLPSASACCGCWPPTSNGDADWRAR